MSNDGDMIWVLLSACLVFLMQAGFLCLETGFTRKKHNINVAMKNLVDFTLATLVFWAFGYALMFGLSRGGLLGTTGLAPNLAALPMSQVAFFFFQAMFAGTAVTILSGAIAERVNFNSYLITTLLISGLTYPLFGHWVWGGVASGEPAGWLARQGFVDFAGGTVVHSLGGWTALAVLLIIGPRQGRFPAGRPPREMPASNIPVATLGALLLFMGWFGFNGGSTLAFNDQIGRILTNTLLGGTAGLAATLLWQLLNGQPTRPAALINGLLAGLVGVTAGAFVFSTAAAVFVGAVGGLTMLATENLLIRYQIDDAVGAVPVHLGAGIWGTLAVALIGDLDLLGTGLGRLAQLGVQSLGIAVCAVWVFAVSTFILRVFNHYHPLRITAADEATGLNVSQHASHNPLDELMQVMEEQTRTGEWDKQAPVEPFTEAGRIAEYYNRVIDLLNQEIYRASTIVSKAMDAFVTISKQDLRVISFNPAAEEIFGYADDVIQDQSIGVLLRTSENEPVIQSNEALHIFKPLFRRILKTRRPFELIGRRANGERFPVEISLTETTEGESGFLIATFRDVSKQRTAREALENANRELSLARDEAVAASRFKGQLLGKVSHELRTPLGAILGYAELLKGGVFGKLSADQGEVTDEIIESTRYLADLVNDLLDQARLESGQLKIVKSPFEIKELFFDVRGATSIMATSRELALNFNIDPRLPKVLLGDKHRLQQILINLISNAIKFTDEGTVDVHASALENGRWMLRVRDSGRGIPHSEQKLIFEPFKQVDGSLTREKTGTGLGLAIVKQLANLMGGDVTLKSQLGKGSSFTVWFPLEVPEETAVLEEIPAV